MSMNLKPNIKNIFKGAVLDLSSHEGFENIRESFFSCYRPEFRGYGELMEYIEKDYGRLARVLMFFAMLNDYLHADVNGGYENFFSNGYLTLTDESPDESPELDLLKREGAILAEFVAIYDKHSASTLNQHFENVKVKLDTREIIKKGDEEYDAILKIYEEAQGASKYEDYVPRNIEVLLFNNPHEYELTDLEKLKVHTHDLIDEFSRCSLSDRLYNYFKTEYELLGSPLPVIDLQMCYTGDDPFKLRQVAFDNPLVFIDKLRPPEEEAQRLLTMIKEYDGHDGIQVNTSSKDIFNILRYLLKMEAVVFLNDYFTFKPFDEKIIKIKTNTGFKNKNVDPAFVKFITTNILDKVSESLDDVIEVIENA